MQCLFAGPNSQKLSMRDRRKALRDLYLFECNCKHCANKVENVGSAFACPKCGPRGALIVSLDHNYCVLCNGENFDIREACDKLVEVKELLARTWPLVEMQRYQQAEAALQRLLDNYGKYFYEKCDLMLELKEKLGFVLDLQKKPIAAAKHWLDCFYGQVETDGYDDSYEALFYLLKITQALIEDADRTLDRLDKVKTNLDKAKKYFNRAMAISKKLQGKECRVLEARSDILEQMPEPTAVAKDLHTLENFLQVAAQQISAMGK